MKELLLISLTLLCCVNRDVNCNPFEPMSDLCSEIPSCTTTDTGYTKPYPPDCGKYIYCNKAGPGILSYCAAGKEYNPATNMCMAAAQANCPKCFTTTLAPYCPATPVCTAKGQQLPYPPNCGQYIYCDLVGGGILSSCKPGIDHFSPTQLRCLPIAEANCPYCREPTEAPPTLPTCPATPTCGTSDTGARKPYPPDCEKYIYCTGTEAQLSLCPVDNHFSSTENVCRPIAEANCPLCQPIY
ncbi:hypothetical protein B566_EDAN010410 [Ephemera danica]|nr:hypothetical protein B566_EDAN010410 [Ephemera danica]